MLLYVILAASSALFILFLVYNSLLWGLAKRVKPTEGSDNTTELPRISVIIPCHGDSPELEAKVKHTLSLYPLERMQVITIWSQPPEQSSEVIERLRSTPVELLIEEVRTGKSNALNLALDRAREEIVVITDVDTELEDKSLTSLIRNFAQPTVGAVSGRLYYRYREVQDPLSEILFNRNERQLRDYEALIDSCSFAPGELLAFRRDLVPHMPKDSICDDLYICWKVRSLGFRCTTQPSAVAYETPPRSLGGSITKTRRIVTGALVEVSRFRFMLFRRKYGLFGSFIMPFQVAKIAVGPLLVLLLLASLALYVISLPPPVPGAALLTVAAIALLMLLPRLRRRFRGTINSGTGYILGTLLGLFDYLLGRRSSIWKPAK